MEAPQQLQSEKHAATPLLEIIAILARELHPLQTAWHPPTLDSHLERDLGFDSLGRLELVARLERQFGVSLPEQSFAEAETPRDLLRAILSSPTTTSWEGTSPVSTPEAGRSNEAPEQAGSLTEMLDWHVAHHGERTHICLYSDSDEGERISYRQLHEGALKVAAALQRHGLQPGEAVCLMLPTGPDYFYSFFGVLYAGGVPVPIYPPLRPSQLQDHLRRQISILSNAKATYLITIEAAKPLAKLLKAEVESLRELLTLDALHGNPQALSPVILRSIDTAFLQYTSGSTGTPKGVILTHANLLANIRADGAAIEANASDIFVSWLPLYHDMGLIGAWLGSLYFGAQLVIMSPLSFLAKPERWLWAIHRYGGTLSAAPNFAYQLCCSRIDDKALEGLDLSRWRVALNGAEAVSPETVQNFQARFSAYGFHAEALCPVYGLAESSVGLTFPPLHRKPLIDRIRRLEFSRSGQAIAAEPDDPRALRFVACGHPLPHHEVRVVNAASHELPERQQGAIQFRGPSACSGYFHNSQATRELFDGEWLRSGDLGYFADGDLFITGRSKDVIIRAGRNIYPEELEEAIGNLEGIRKGRVAIFSSQNQNQPGERLVILAETREQDPAKREALSARIDSIATYLTMIAPDEIILAAPGIILKTSSGKIRRGACRTLFEQGAIKAHPRPVWQQLLQLSLSTLPNRIRRIVGSAKDWAYSLYARGIFYILAAFTYLSVMLLPTTFRWPLMRAMARLLAMASGTRLTLRGAEYLPTVTQPVILVANHCSYLDGIALVALLPFSFRFVAKSELRRNWIAHTFLKRINTLFVERSDTRQAVTDTDTAQRSALQGESQCYFPEGTFSRRPGLLPFHMGAFSTAANAALPVQPITIRGTRSILHANDWFIHPSQVSLTLCEPVVSAPGVEDAWQQAILLRDRARTEILRHCGEPDLASEKRV
jgi:1-acyl-sn-glycerol-3-phosphate acyltransferase